MAIELPDGLEVGRRVQADHFVGKGADLVQHIRGRHRSRADQPGRLAAAQGVQRGNHGRAGGQAVVDHDDDPPGHINRRATRRVPGAAAAQDVELDLAFLLDMPLHRRRIPRPGVAVHPAALVHRAEGKFGVVGRADLAHHDHIQLALKVVCERTPHRHRTPRNGQDQRRASLVGMQGFGQPVTGLDSILKQHGSSSLTGVCAGSPPRSTPPRSDAMVALGWPGTSKVAPLMPRTSLLVRLDTRFRRTYDPSAVGVAGNLRLTRA